MSATQAQRERIRELTAQVGACYFCAAECGPNSTICPACAFNPKRRKRYEGVKS